MKKAAFLILGVDKKAKKYNIISMELCQKKKILLLILAACIFFTIVFTETLSAADHNHDCIGSDCPICLVIEAGHNFLKTLKFTCLLFFAAFLTFSAHILTRNTRLNAFSLSPVTLKVRFNS